MSTTESPSASGFSAATLVAIPLTSLICIAQCAVLVCAVRLIVQHRSRSSSDATSGGGGTSSVSHANLGAHGHLLGFSIPSLLRWSFLLSSVCALLLGLITVADLPVHVRDVFHQTWRTTDWSDLTPAEIWCIISSKGGCAAYVLAKFFSYIFFFAKQRTVRPMSQSLSFMEKQALLGTACVIGFLVVLVITAQGDANRVDGTCNAYVPIGLLTFNLVADTGLSTIYLYLFIQPLRATIAANRRVQASHLAGAGAALETVMRRNMLSCLVSVISCTISMTWMLIGHATEQPFMRKWIGLMGTLDVFITTASVAHSFHKSATSSSSSSTNAVVPLHTIHDASVNNGTPKLPLHAGGPISKASSREVTTTSQPRAHHPQPLHALATAGPSRETSILLVPPSRQPSLRLHLNPSRVERLPQAHSCTAHHHADATTTIATTVAHTSALSPTPERQPQTRRMTSGGISGGTLLPLRLHSRSRYHSMRASFDAATAGVLPPVMPVLLAGDLATTDATTLTIDSSPSNANVAPTSTSIESAVATPPLGPAQSSSPHPLARPALPRVTSIY